LPTPSTTSGREGRRPQLKAREAALWPSEKAAATAAAAAGRPGGALGGHFHPLEATDVNGSADSS